METRQEELIEKAKAMSTGKKMYPDLFAEPSFMDEPLRPLLQGVVSGNLLRALAKSGFIRIRDIVKYQEKAQELVLGLGPVKMRKILDRLETVYPGVCK
ncbi:MAG: hypothetical protein R6V40_02380 [Candidatus Moraniibacteriota bacterium]